MSEFNQRFVDMANNWMYNPSNWGVGLREEYAVWLGQKGLPSHDEEAAKQFLSEHGTKTGEDYEEE